MRNLKIILSVAIIAALAMSFAACGDPETEPDPTVTWTVTIDLSALTTADLTACFFDYYGNWGSSSKTTKT